MHKLDLQTPCAHAAKQRPSLIHYPLADTGWQMPSTRSWPYRLRTNPASHRMRRGRPAAAQHPRALEQQGCPILPARPHPGQHALTATLRGRSSSASTRVYIDSHSLLTPYMDDGQPLPFSLRML